MRRWKNIKSAPRYTQPILLWAMSKMYEGDELIAIGLWNGNAWVYQNGRDLHFEPTHWMYLPKSPIFKRDKPHAE